MGLEMNCPKCGLTWQTITKNGFVGLHPQCNCFNDTNDLYNYKIDLQKEKKMIEKSNIPEKFTDMNKLQWLDVPEANKIKEAINYYVSNLKDNYENAKSLIIIGKKGIGKTHAQCLIGMMIIKKLKKQVRYISLTKFIINCHALSYNHGEQRNYIEKHINSYVLILDDIGESRVEEWNKKYIFELLDGRNNKKCITLISTMNSKEELESRIGEHIVSRIFEIVQDNICVCESQIDMRDYNNYKKYLRNKQNGSV